MLSKGTGLLTEDSLISIDFRSKKFAKYKDNMYTFEFKDGTGYAVKPMNCPGHITIFEREPHSYRDLPVKYSEPGQVISNLVDLERIVMEQL